MTTCTYGWFEVGPWHPEAMGQTDPGRALIDLVEKIADQEGALDRSVSDEAVPVLRMEFDGLNYGTSVFDSYGLRDAVAAAGLWLRCGDAGGGNWGQGIAWHGPGGERFSCSTDFDGRAAVSRANLGRIFARGQDAERVNTYLELGDAHIGELVAWAADGSLATRVARARGEAIEPVSIEAGVDGEEEQRECPECGGEVQGTSKVYWSLGPGGWRVHDASDEDLAIYCANDHDLYENEDLDRSLGEAVRTVGERIVDDVAIYRVRCGQPAAATGSGSAADWVVQWHEGGLVQAQASEAGCRVVAFDFDELREGEADYDYVWRGLKSLRAVPATSGAAPLARQMIDAIVADVARLHTDRPDLQRLVESIEDLDAVAPASP